MVPASRLGRMRKSKDDLTCSAVIHVDVTCVLNCFMELDDNKIRCSGLYSDFELCTGYNGELCNDIIDPCDSDPCYRGGACTHDGAGNYNCNCESGKSFPTRQFSLRDFRSLEVIDRCCSPLIDE